MIEVEHVNVSEWKAFTQRHVVFGHQSVGQNVLSGVQLVAEKAGVTIQITKSKASPLSYGITHFEIGKNDDPTSKMKDFEESFNSGALQNADIAMMKLCYIDIKSGTDAKKLAEDYVATMDRLSSKFPRTTFIAVTTPLTTLQNGPKAWVKQLMGKSPSGYVENYRRLEFNKILREKYGRQGRLFDLARFEAEGVDKYNFQGQSVEMMNPDFSSDGGHLNSFGQSYIASKMIKYIALLPASITSHP